MSSDVLMLRPGVDFVQFSSFLDLLQYVQETGEPLPHPIGDIIQIEAAGFAVNLTTGCLDAVAEDYSFAEQVCRKESAVEGVD